MIERRCSMGDRSGSGKSQEITDLTKARSNMVCESTFSVSGTSVNDKLDKIRGCDLIFVCIQTVDNHIQVWIVPSLVLPFPAPSPRPCHRLEGSPSPSTVHQIKS